MRGIYYLILIGFGVLLSIPMTIIIIAFETANRDKDKIKEYFGYKNK